MWIPPYQTRQVAVCQWLVRWTHNPAIDSFPGTAGDLPTESVKVTLSRHFLGSMWDMQEGADLYQITGLLTMEA